jgi:hypothetical protein
MERACPSLVTQGWAGDKPYLVTVNTGMYMTFARPEIGAGWPERLPNQPYTLQTVSGEAFTILKEVFLVHPGAAPTENFVLVISTMNEFILGLDVVHAYDVSVNLGRQTLRLAEEEVSLWSPGTGPRPLSLVVITDQLIPAQCKGVVVALLVSHLGIENVLV